MFDIPVIKIEIERVKNSVSHVLTDRNNELNEMIIEELDSVLTEKWVREEISRAVTSCVRQAIQDVANNWQLKQAITDLVGRSIEGLVNEKAPTENPQ